MVAVCFRNDGQNVNEWLVQEGWALDWPKYSIGIYADVQAIARAASRGVWRGKFVEPWNWRAGSVPLGLVSAQSPTASCRIKGNISADGERIYHMPSDAFYDRTRIDESNSERWFCPPKEAEEAGWRRSRR